MKSANAFEHHRIEVALTALVIPTYRSGPPDPNPPLFGKGVRAIYPYAWRKSFTREIADRSYDALVLRSPWMELTFLPDWGFHLYRAVDRQTGRDLFHRPAVMKPAHNAIRGAYVAGGVEFNFPIGHNAMTWDRVGLNVRKTADGVTVLFQDVERRSGMHWAAGVTLTAGMRGVRFDQFFYNATALPQPWYFWLNAGMAAHPSLRFVFPTAQMLGHFEGSFLDSLGWYSFPVHQGHDYSRFADIPEPIGLFSPSNYFGWFGAWYEDWDFGLARWAAPWQVGGQKLWSWGNSEEGHWWGRIAADQELPIPEIQSGRPETQMDRQILRPYDHVAHSEWWFPVSGLGGLQAASRFAAINVTSENDQAILKCSPTESVPACQILVNDQPLPGQVDLTPGQIYQVRLPRPRGELRRIQLRTARGSILDWTSEPAPLAPTLGTITDCLEPLAEASAETLFLKGCRAQRTLRPDLARRFYQQALARDPGHSATHRQFGLLGLLAGQPATALDDLEQALIRNRWDEEALYLHGLAAGRAGHRTQALADWYRVAATGDAYVVPALLQLAEDALRREEWEELRHLLADAGRRDPDNAHRYFLQSVAARRQSGTDQVEPLGRELDRVLGVSLLARFERRWDNRTEETLRLAADPETEDRLRLAAALHYAALGQTHELAALGNEVQSPAVKTALSYLMGPAGTALRPAPETPLVWAWGETERQALAASLVHDPNDPVAHFGLGCLLAETGQLESAVHHLREAAQRRPGDSVVRTALGRVYLESARPQDAVRELTAAVAGQPENPTAWVLLDQALGLAGQRNESWRQRLESVSGLVRDSDEFCETRARLASDLGHHDDAARVLAARWFHPYELTHHLRTLWVRIHQDQAVTLAQAGQLAAALAAIETALGYPENLQLGKPLRSFDARTLYTAGRILDLAKQPAAARSYYQRATAEDQPGPTPAKLWAALAEWELGSHDQALARLSALAEEAGRYLAAGFQPDLEPELARIVDWSRRFRESARPALEELLQLR